MATRFVTPADYLRGALESIEDGKPGTALWRINYAVAGLRAEVGLPLHDLRADLMQAVMAARALNLPDLAERILALESEVNEMLGGTGGTYVTKTAFGDRTGD